MISYLVSAQTHRRAKRIILKIIPPREVRITLPLHVSRAVIPEILEKNKHWIETAIGQVEPASLEPALPDYIHFPSIQVTLPIDLEFALTHQVQLREEFGTLKIRGAVDHPHQVKSVLRDWLKLQGQLHLPAWLERTSQRTGLSYRKAVVRLQRTRWASCTAKHDINLNARLLFLDPDLVEYVMIHELCHTVHLNHSSKFWQLVAKFSPDFRILDKRLTQTGRRLPAWIRF
jgi:predicted metal-dependent hydrolase